jgi:hypothetical protein
LSLASIFLRDQAQVIREVDRSLFIHPPVHLLAEGQRCKSEYPDHTPKDHLFHGQPFPPLQMSNAKIQISNKFQMSKFKGKRNLDEECQDLKFDIELISFELWVLTFGIGFILMHLRPILS